MHQPAIAVVLESSHSVPRRVDYLEEIHQKVYRFSSNKWSVIRCCGASHIQGFTSVSNHVRLSSSPTQPTSAAANLSQQALFNNRYTRNMVLGFSCSVILFFNRADSESNLPICSTDYWCWLHVWSFFLASCSSSRNKPGDTEARSLLLNPFLLYISASGCLQLLWLLC